MQLFNYRLRNAPLPAKVMILSLMTSLCLAYVYALGNILLVVGWRPQDIAIHYYGAAQAPQSSTQKNNDKQGVGVDEGEQSLDLDQLVDTSPSPVVIKPSFKNLVQEGHFHLFGMTSFFFILTFLALFTGAGSFLKTTLVSTPYFAIIFDNISFMATRFWGPSFAYLTAVSGAFLGLCFSGLILVIVLEILKKPEEV